MPKVRLVRGSFDAKEGVRVAVAMVMSEAKEHWKVPPEALSKVIGGVLVLIVGMFFFRPLIPVGASVVGPILGALIVALLALVLAPVAILLRLVALRLFGPRAVNTEERELSISDIERGLRDGRLSPQDLVEEDRNWKTLLESRELGEVADDRHRRDEKRQLLTKLALIPVGMSLVLVAGWMFMKIPTFFRWLAEYDWAGLWS